MMITTVNSHLLLRPLFRSVTLIIMIIIGMIDYIQWEQWWLQLDIIGDPDLSAAKLSHFFISRDHLDFIISLWGLPVFDGNTMHEYNFGDDSFKFKVVDKRLRLQYNLGSGVFTIFSTEVGLNGWVGGWIYSWETNLMFKDLTLGTWHSVVVKRYHQVLITHHHQ